MRQHFCLKNKDAFMFYGIESRNKSIHKLKIKLINQFCFIRKKILIEFLALFFSITY